MDKKWYSFFVTIDSPEESPAEKAATPPPKGVPKGAPKAAPSAAQTVADIAASVVKSEPKFTTPVKDPASFEDIYAAAEDRKSTRLNSSHIQKSRMPSSA